MTSRWSTRTRDSQNLELIAVRVLGFLCERPTMLDRFLSANGLPGSALSQRPIASKLARAALDFLVADEGALIEFSRRTAISVEATYRARQLFVGRDDRAPEDFDEFGGTRAVRSPAEREAALL